MREASYDEHGTPIVISFDGEYRYPSFSFGADTEVEYSCAVQYQGQYYVFGGYNILYQISKIVGCELQRQGDLPFQFRQGSCGVYPLNGVEEILLCFSESDRKMCHSYTGTFTSVASSNYGHYASYLSTYQSKPLIIGGAYHTKIEMLENGGTAQQSWNIMPDYPYGSE